MEVEGGNGEEFKFNHESQYIARRKSRRKEEATACSRRFPFHVGVQFQVSPPSRLWVRRGLNRVSISHTMTEGGRRWRDWRVKSAVLAG